MTVLARATHHFQGFGGPHHTMESVATIILGGGQGTRLSPLTMSRCKPAVCFAGKHRIIDFSMSNAINSGCSKIFVLTQFLSTSLHQHIVKTYRLGTFSHGFIELLPAEQGPANKTWFQGTADAVRQNMMRFQEIPADYFLILSGDQVYNFNFQKMLNFAFETDADLVIASLPVNEHDAKRMGILTINEDSFIKSFHEKPQEQQLLHQLRIPKHLLINEHLQYLGSMGIYLFKRETLFHLLKEDKREDFGKHLIPTEVHKGKAAAYLYEGYWEDIGTISTFYRANIALTHPDPSFNCYDERHPIFSEHFHLPAPKIASTNIQNAIICEGSLVEAEEVTHSILGPRTVVREGTIIRNSYLMGHEHYIHPVRAHANLEVGRNCLLENVIIDQHASIGNHVQLVNKQKLTHYNSDLVFIHDGVIVVPRGVSIPDGFIL